MKRVLANFRRNEVEPEKEVETIKISGEKKRSFRRRSRNQCHKIFGDPSKLVRFKIDLVLRLRLRASFTRCSDTNMTDVEMQSRVKCTSVLVFLKPSLILQ